MKGWMGIWSGLLILGLLSAIGGLDMNGLRWLTTKPPFNLMIQVAQLLISGVVVGASAVGCVESSQLMLRRHRRGW